MLKTVKDNKKFLTRQDIVDADKARNYQTYLGWMYTSTFVSYVSKHLITNYGITVDDIKQTGQIYGTPTPLLKRNL